MHKIIEVQVLENYRFHITFLDGTQGNADVSELVGKGVFALWNDYEEFRKVKIADTGELFWSEQVDLCPDSLFLRITGKGEIRNIKPGFPEQSKIMKQR